MNDIDPPGYEALAFRPRWFDPCFTWYPIIKHFKSLGLAWFCILRMYVLLTNHVVVCQLDRCSWFVNCPVFLLRYPYAWALRTRTWASCSTEQWATWRLVMNVRGLNEWTENAVWYNSTPVHTAWGQVLWRRIYEVNTDTSTCGYLPTYRAYRCYGTGTDESPDSWLSSITLTTKSRNAVGSTAHC